METKCNNLEKKLTTSEHENQTLKSKMEKSQQQLKEQEIKEKEMQRTCNKATARIQELEAENKDLHLALVTATKLKTKVEKEGKEKYEQEKLQHQVSSESESEDRRRTRRRRRRRKLFVSSIFFNENLSGLVIVLASSFFVCFFWGGREVKPHSTFDTSCTVLFLLCIAIFFFFPFLLFKTRVQKIY